MVSSIPELKGIDQALQYVWEGLSLAPGSLFRIAHQFLPNWGVEVTDENKAWIAQTSLASYLDEWSRGTAESNRAIERSIKKGGLKFGNEDLNIDVAEYAATLLLAMSEHKKTFRICDVGAGNGSTTVALLNKLATLTDAGILPEGFASGINFVLLEPSPSRLVEARERIVEQLGITDVEFYGSTLERNFSKTMDGTYDMIISSAVLHHMTFDDHLRLMREKLSDDGVLVMGDWFTTVWQHPAYMVRMLEDLKASQDKIRRFKVLFNVKDDDVRRLDHELRPEQRGANKQMYKYIRAAGEEMQRIGANSKLCLFEAHESLDDRRKKLRDAGYETELEELRSKHKAFVHMDSVFKSLYPDHDIAGVLVAAKRHGRQKPRPSLPPQRPSQ